MDTRRSIRDIVPLWRPFAPNWVSSSWEEISNHLDEVGENWNVWTDWYQDRLDGKPLDEELELKKALIPNEVWEQGPAVVNKRIAEIIREHEAEKQARREDRPEGGGGEPPRKPPIIPRQGGGDGFEFDPAQAGLFEANITFEAALDDEAVGPALTRFTNLARAGLHDLLARRDRQVLFQNAYLVEHISLQTVSVRPGSVKLTLKGTIHCVALVVGLLAGWDPATAKLEDIIDWVDKTFHHVIDEYGRTEDDPVLPITHFEIVARPEGEVIAELMATADESRLARTQRGDQPLH